MPTQAVSPDRKLSKRARELVLERDEYTCRMCGAENGTPHHEYPRITKLVVAHIVHRCEGGTDASENLRALCQPCNDGWRTTRERKREEFRLLTDVGRSRERTQLTALASLVRKFPVEARHLLGKVDGARPAPV